MPGVSPHQLFNAYFSWFSSNKKQNGIFFLKTNKKKISSPFQLLILNKGKHDMPPSKNHFKKNFIKVYQMQLLTDCN